MDVTSWSIAAGERYGRVALALDDHDERQSCAVLYPLLPVLLPALKDFRRPVCFFTKSHN